MKFNVGDRVAYEGYEYTVTNVARALYLDDEDVAWLEDVGKQENFRAPDFWERHGKLLARAKGEQP